MRFPFFRPKPNETPGYEFHSIGSACVGRIINWIITMAIILVVIYLFYKNPPWFQQLKESIINYFQK